MLQGIRGYDILYPHYPGKFSEIKELMQKLK